MEIKITEESTAQEFFGALEMSVISCYLALKSLGAPVESIINMKLCVDKLHATALNLIVVTADREADPKLRNKFSQQLDIELQNFRGLLDFIKNQMKENLQ